MDAGFSCLAASDDSIRHPDSCESSTTLSLMVRRRAIAGAACVHLAAMRAVSNHGGKFGLAAILRDALASLGLLRMRSEWSKIHRRENGNPGMRNSAKELGPTSAGTSGVESSNTDHLALPARGGHALEGK